MLERFYEISKAMIVVTCLPFCMYIFAQSQPYATSVGCRDAQTEHSEKEVFFIQMLFILTYD